MQYQDAINEIYTLEQNNIFIDMNNYIVFDSFREDQMIQMKLSGNRDVLNFIKLHIKNIIERKSPDIGLFIIIYNNNNKFIEVKTRDSFFIEYKKLIDVLESFNELRLFEFTDKTEYLKTIKAI